MSQKRAKQLRRAKKRSNPTEDRPTQAEVAEVLLEWRRVQRELAFDVLDRNAKGDRLVTE